ncbi:hypothetical protein ES703_106144 [subsurface metagenome]
MAKVMFEINGIVILDSIDSEEDLKPRPGIRCIINPPPSDGRCRCCGRHLTELRPFDFDGALLVKMFRAHSPPDEELDAIWEKYTWNCDSGDDYRKAKEKMIQELGEEKAELVETYAHARATSYPSWECRDCFFLDSQTYHEKIYERYRKDEEMARGELRDQNGQRVTSLPEPPEQ